MSALHSFHELLVVAGMLAFLGLAGLPLASRLPKLGPGSAVLAAPVVAFGWLAITSTVLYQMGFPPRAGLVALAATAAVGFWTVRRDRRGHQTAAGQPGTAAIATAVLILLLLPAWMGGPRFAIFQGNQFDQRNYIAAAVAYRHHSYPELNPASAAPLPTPIADFGRMNLLYRPAVAVAYAALADLMPGPLVTSAYAYRVLLQSLWFFAQDYLLVSTLGFSWLRGAVLSAALTLGFFSQHVFDLNAWSQAAGMPMMVVALGVAIGGLFGEQRPPSPLSLGLRITLALGPAAHLYPEILAAALPAFVILLLVTALRGPRHQALARALSLLFAALATFATCLLYWKGTLVFLVNEVRSQGLNAPSHWTAYFDAFVRGVDPADWTRNGRWTLYGLLSAVVDPLTSLMGLYFLRPSPDLSFVIRAMWKVSLGGLLGAILVSSGKTAWSLLRAVTAAGACVAAALASCLLPLVLLATGRTWQAGKILSMVAPLLFTALVLPLSSRSSGSWRRASPAAVFVLLQLGFGLFRPLAARNPSGVHYAAPYPGVQDVGLKNHPWDLERLSVLLSSCRDVAVSMEDPWLEDFTDLYLADTEIRWSSRKPPRLYYGGVVPSGGDPKRRDCVLASGPTAVYPGERVIWWEPGRVLTPEAALPP